MLLAARDPETGTGMSDKQLRDEILTIFLAGHETTANALSWTWYLLARHPEAEARLHDELDRVLGGRLPNYADLAELKWTRMVIEEAMRLYPPAHTIARTALGEDRIGGVRVPAGAIITVSIYMTHRNPNLWPEPERFDPERFAPEESAQAATASPICRSAAARASASAAALRWRRRRSSWPPSRNTTGCASPPAMWFRHRAHHSARQGRHLGHPRAAAPRRANRRQSRKSKRRAKSAACP